MIKKALLYVLFIITGFSVSSQQNYVLVIHGGAGVILKKNMTDEREAAYVDKMMEALETGEAILKNGGTALDAVTETVNIMEDSPLFNAGRGSVFTAAGVNEMDASIMDGSNLKGGAVASVRYIKNPIDAARKVMEESPHVLLVGEGAERFAIEHGVDTASASYFFEQRRYDSWKKASSGKHGTVGAVALDMHGNLAAATSTGGMTNKMTGRAGDTPIIGAGTYANNATCAVSATGHGEYFIRNVVAYDISALMQYKSMSLEEASNHVIMEKLVEQGAKGGIIAVDKEGNFSMPFNTPGMFRGYVISDGSRKVAIYE
jgi:beta-aspartyl-peptidase (threonine type)